MSAPTDMPGSAAEVALAYHSCTKHHLNRYAKGPETLDWTSQPNAFREFQGCPRTLLPLKADAIDTPIAQIYSRAGIAPASFSIESVGALLELSMGISAWKELGPDRWAVRCNPSSGNLHPTEAYVLCHGVSGLEDGLYHYVSRDHALEQRCKITEDQGAARLWIALSSVHWREAWKYGERAFRYCQLDIGHAIGAISYAGAALGWQAHLAEPHEAGALAGLLGLDRDGDFGRAERDDPDLILEIRPFNEPTPENIRPRVDELSCRDWVGQANVLDAHPMYRWPVIDEVAAATRGSAAPAEIEAGVSLPPLQHSVRETVSSIVLRRRSAQRFDREHRMSAADFYHVLDCLLVRSAPSGEPAAGAPWDVWSYVPRIHSVLFIHRVDGLEPGLYVLIRRPEAEPLLRSCFKSEFLWRRPQGVPAHLPLFQLAAVDCRAFARAVSCHQAIASDGCFSLGMLSEFEPIVRSDAWRYRQLHWEAGLLGQVLYLEAEAIGLRGTGIGCFFDDCMHEELGLGDGAFQSLYHFTVGRPLTSDRITTLPAYSRKEVAK